MTPARQEIDHPTSSSSSSTSPTTTVSSDSETRARDAVSCEHVEREERRDPFAEPTKNPKPNNSEDHEKERETHFVQKSLNGCKNSEKIWWMMKFLNMETLTPVLLMNQPSLEPARSADLGKHSVYTHFPKDRPEDALAQPHLVQKIFW